MNEQRFDQIVAQFGEHTRATAETFGALAGGLKFYMKAFPKAMDELKMHGCEHCNKRKCSRCHDLDGWTWDGLKHD